MRDSRTSSLQSQEPIRAEGVEKRPVRSIQKVIKRITAVRGNYVPTRKAKTNTELPQYIQIRQKQSYNLIFLIFLTGN